MAGFEIEPLAGDSDLDGVLEVGVESFTNPWTREMYVAELGNESVCHVWVVRTNESSVAGFCAFWLVCDEVHINNLAIRPGLRGQGLGTALVQAVLGHAVAVGAMRATLEVRESNVDARRLYERLGFYVGGRRPGYYIGPVEDALIFWWDRPPAGSDTGRSQYEN